MKLNFIWIKILFELPPLTYKFCLFCRLIKDETGLVVLQYKKWPMDLEWHPQHEKIHLFKTCNGKQLVPSGVPPPVQPSWENTQLEKLKETIKKVDGFFNNTQREWWQKMLESPPVRDEADWCWPLENWVDLQDKNYLLNQPLINPVLNGVTPLTHAMRKERELRQVCN